MIRTWYLVQYLAGTAAMSATMHSAGSTRGGGERAGGDACVLRDYCHLVASRHEIKF